MKTVNYEAQRNIPQTTFNPPWLEQCTIERYLAESGVAKNKLLTFDLFDNVTKIKETGNKIQAVGINFKTNNPTVLILKKK